MWRMTSVYLQHVDQTLERRDLDEGELLRTKPLQTSREKKHVETIESHVYRKIRIAYLWYGLKSSFECFNLLDFTISMAELNEACP